MPFLLRYLMTDCLLFIRRECKKLMKYTPIVIIIILTYRVRLQRIPCATYHPRWSCENGRRYSNHRLTAKRRQHIVHVFSIVHSENEYLNIHVYLLAGFEGIMRFARPKEKTVA